MTDTPPDRLSVDTRAQRQVRRLSGGNQQKVVLGRWLTTGFKTLLCFDPTRGIDLQTKQQIYDLLKELEGVLRGQEVPRERSLKLGVASVLPKSVVHHILATGQADRRTTCSTVLPRSAFSGSISLVWCAITMRSPVFSRAYLSIST